MKDHIERIGGAVARRFKQLRLSERGATAVEYGIMVALIAVVIITAVWGIGRALKDDFECVENSLEYSYQGDAPAYCEEN